MHEKPSHDATSGAARRAVFLDRDGVLIRTNIRNGRPYAITPSDVVNVLGGVPESCSALLRAGFILVMVTNQPDVARGTTPRGFVEDVNGQIRATLGLHAVQVCYHDDKDDCDCRKPRPGLLTSAAEAFDIDLTRSAMVGDRWRDIEAGRRAGCRTVLIGDGYDETGCMTPDFTAASLADAMPWIVSQLSR